MGCPEDGWANTTRYAPPTRTSISQDSRVRPDDFGTHQRWNKSALLQAWKTRRAGPLKVRVTTSSRSDFRSTVVGLCPAFIVFLLLFQFRDHLIQRIEARGPHLAVRLHPCRLFRQRTRAEPAGPHAPDLL